MTVYLSASSLCRGLLYVVIPLPQSVYSQDENGVNRPVCSYVRVLRAGRLLESPRQAARFVSLLAHEKALFVGGGDKHEQWCTLMAFLCRRKVRINCVSCSRIGHIFLMTAHL